jgi:tetratricopeptide (TPR) repeat protein
MKGYTTQDVTHLLGLSTAQVRSLTGAGVLDPDRGPRGTLRFSFQDLVVLRAAKGLLAARLPLARIRKALRGLRRQLPRGRSLAELRITAEDGRIVVHDGRAAWNPESDQLQLDFNVAALAIKAAPVARRAAKAAQAAEADLGAEDWYALGLELEAVRGAPAEARDAYRRALELDAHHADAHVNLGRLLQEDGRMAEAEKHYRQALAGDPEHVTAAFNLGIVLEDLGRVADAIDAYRKALGIDGKLGDAHYNLACLYDRLGKKAAALRHFGAYRRLTER